MRQKKQTVPFMKARKKEKEKQKPPQKIIHFLTQEETRRLFSAIKDMGFRYY